MTREREPLNLDEIHTAESGLAETMRIRVEQLPRAERQHAHQNQRLLKHALEPVNALQIFPTVEVSKNAAPGRVEIVKENLLFVTSAQVEPEYIRIDYFLTPSGELVEYTKVGDYHARVDSAPNRAYILHANTALLAIEKTIRSAIQTEIPTIGLVKE